MIAFVLLFAVAGLWAEATTADSSTVQVGCGFAGGLLFAYCLVRAWRWGPDNGSDGGNGGGGGGGGGGRGPEGPHRPDPWEAFDRARAEWESARPRSRPRTPEPV